MSQILFLSRWFPYPPSNGSKLRIFNLLRGLAEAGHSVRLLSFVEPDYQPVGVSAQPGGDAGRAGVGGSAQPGGDAGRAGVGVSAQPGGDAGRAGVGVSAQPGGDAGRAGVGDAGRAEAVLAGLRPYCQSVWTTPWRQFAPASSRARLGFFSATPRSVRDTWSAEMAQMIGQELATHRPDLIIASQIDTAAYVPANSGVPALFEEIEIGLMMEQYTAAATLGQRLRYGLTWAKYRRYLASLLGRFAACTVVSQREQHLLAAAAPGFPPAEIIPNCLHLPDYQSTKSPIYQSTNSPSYQSTNSPIYQSTKSPSYQSTNSPSYQSTQSPSQHLIFTGAFTYHVNYEGARWFVERVLPLVQAQVSDVHLTITGNHADRPFPQVAGVTLTGFVDDVRPLLAGAAVCIVPIWQGGGTRLKILEAMALGTPVVATSKGAEGLDAQPGVHLLIADQPAAFADAVVRLLVDAPLRQRLAEHGRALVEQQYSWPLVMPRFLQLVERLAASSADHASMYGQR
jgi:glycosyltransferase involved in cell wall biosynthesis